MINQRSNFIKKDKRILCNISLNFNLVTTSNVIVSRPIVFNWEELIHTYHTILEWPRYEKSTYFKPKAFSKTSNGLRSLEKNVVICLLWTHTVLFHLANASLFLRMERTIKERVYRWWNTNISRRKRVQVNFSRFYSKKFYGKNLLNLISPEGPPWLNLMDRTFCNLAY